MEKWPDNLLDAMRRRGDPLADETIARIVALQGPEEARMLFDNLIRRLEMPIGEFPPLIKDFLAATRKLPLHTDRAKVALAHEFFIDHGPKLLLSLYYKSLPLLYSCANGAQVLVRTSRLTNKDKSLRIFSRRIAETGQFLIDVMTKGALAPGKTGIQSIQKVRLIHASIRFFIQNREWDENAYGKPINQEDMALTLMTFSTALVDALKKFGIEESPEREEAFLHTWTAIGHNLGIREELLPANLSEGRLLLDRILERQSAASEAGQLLTKALAEFGKDIMPLETLKIAPEAFIRYFTGPKTGEALGISPKVGCLGFVLPAALASFFRLVERLEDKFEGPVSDWMDRLSRSLTIRMIEVFNQYKGRKFHIPKTMQRAWKIPEINGE